MAEYDASTYGERIAGVYDAWPTVPANAEAVVARLAALAGRGPVLELGIGTGRIALPLAARGLAVHGIDASPAMVAELRAKPGGDRIPVTMGDFGEVPAPGRFTLIFVVFNTFFGLPTQEAQVRCFASVSEHLTDDGVFVLEAFVPDVARFDRGQRLGVTHLGADLTLEASLHDPVAQRVRSRQVVLSEAGTRIYPVEIRYAWPAELDLMARLAGLELRERWAGWDRTPFTAASATHVSLYARPSGSR
ncbi:MAG: class I SAM-dependent methyltransferase [Candidatus Rokubacteria bacterium]|nr:class I SAM-dependent methyltransferase [Candidatus Rokubacteria bacterium]